MLLCVCVFIVVVVVVVVCVWGQKRRCFVILVIGSQNNDMTSGHDSYCKYTHNFV